MTPDRKVKCFDCLTWQEVRREQDLRGNTAVRIVMHRRAGGLFCRGSNARVEQLPNEETVAAIAAAEESR